MALNIPGELFNRRDVRETETIDIKQENYNTDDFSVAVNIVSLKPKTKYWSYPGLAMNVYNDDTDGSFGADDWENNVRGTIKHLDASAGSYLAPVNLPDGAIVTSAKMTGSSSAETWSLIRNALGTTASGNTMASNTLNSADTSISNATIDNANFRYHIIVFSVDATEVIYDAQITYITDP